MAQPGCGYLLREPDRGMKVSLSFFTIPDVV
jgi:hypothetical protein